MTITSISKNLTVPNLSDNALTILQNRYLQPGETPQDLFLRVAHAVAMAEKEEDREEWTKKFYELMANLYFLPNSPTLVNAGTGKGCMSACFTISPDDSLESILETQKHWSLVEKWGGGVGMGLGKIRPKGDKIHTTHGRALGPIAIMEMYSTNAEKITQGAFRMGAHMAMLPVSHPNVLDFIHCKDNDDKLSNFNISVQVTDEYMRAVEEDRNWDFVNPRNGEITNTIKARDLWHELCESAWKTGDPGIAFIDRVLETQPNPQLGDIIGSNPCWSGNTMVWTIYGPRRFDALVGQEIPVLSVLDNGQMVFKTMRNIRKTKENAKTIKITIESKTRAHREKSELVLTSNHNLFLIDGTKIQAKDLKVGQRLASVYKNKANSKGYLALTNGRDTDMEHRIVASWKHGSRPPYPEFHVDHIDENKQNNHPENLRVLKAFVHNSEKMIGDKNPMRDGWWNNLDESERESHRINMSLATSGENNPMYGVVRSPREIRKCELDTCQNTFEVTIYQSKRFCSVACQRKWIGAFYRGSKGYRQKITSEINHTVVSIEEGPEIDVYNGKVDDTHKYYVQVANGEGILSANCSEEWLEQYNSCNLGSINLGKFVSTNGTIQYENLENVVRVAVRFLDNVVEINEFPFQELKDINVRTRRIGLGIMGWADMLAYLSIPYDSDKALMLAEEVGKCIKDTAIDESRKLADEKGPFLEWQNSAVKNWYPFPIRNSSVITIAPTGTISLIADCSSGLEPYFALAWTRKALWKEQEKEYTEITEVPATLRELFSVNGYAEELISNPASSKEILTNAGVDYAVFRTAMEISPEAHIRMQSSWQKNVTNGVSKTINLPNDATAEDIEEVYKLAWETGCKAVTVYRDGSKGQQVLETGKKIQTRPTKLSGITERVSTGHGVLYTTINQKRKNRPFEIFANLGKSGGCDNAYLEAITRMVSLALRSGISQKDIIKQLSGITCCPIWHEGHQIQSVPDAIAYVLAGGDEENRNELFKAQQAIKLSGNVCPECGGELTHSEGCNLCRACGWSKCD